MPLALHCGPVVPTVPGWHSGSSITELLGALCDSTLKGVSWKRRALGGISREGVRRGLRRRAYGALLSKLFQDGGQSKAPQQPDCLASTPPRNKMLMISFDLRVAGCREEAERLEELLGRLQEGPACGLVELDSSLELLVQLAGSVPPPALSFTRDYMRRERPVLRRLTLGGYQSEELQRLDAQTWALVCGEEWGNLGDFCGSLGFMDAPPGTGLLTLGRRCDSEEPFEKETRLSLFGALQHTRTSDIDIRLDLPPVPSNVDVTGLAIRVPPCYDQSEDEGFQSASNLTPDSQSEASPSPMVDVWEALRAFEPRKRRCWECVGCPPGHKEAPYLTEGGREAFDQLYRLWEGEMRLVSTSQTPSPLLPLPVDCQTQLVKDLLNVFIGVASATFPLNQECMQFDVRPGVCISGASSESVSRLLAELAQYGTNYLRLSHFSLQGAQQKGLVFQAFTGGLRRYLHYYRACVLSTPPTLTLLTIGFLFRKLGRQLRYLSELCCVDGASGTSRATFPVGVKLLSYLYNEAQSNCSNENYPVLLSLLKNSCDPYTRFVSDWVYSGVFRDVYGEFMIQVNEDYLSYRDKHFWMQGYTLVSREVEDFVPVFLKHIANDVYVCGKTINLLKICCPQHYICWSDLRVPRISVTFSLQEVEEIERDCAVYRGRMERIAKHSATSREEKAQRTEQARQELISQVRESAAKTLESIRGRQVSQRLAEEAKKRERFEELKQHLELEQEWRSVARRREEVDDYSYARELRDREKRLQALEEQLELRARKELIAQYSRMTEEAARRERRAVWRVQRMRLDEQRAAFVQRDQQLLEALLEENPLGQPGHYPELPPTAQELQDADSRVSPDDVGSPLSPHPVAPPSAVVSGSDGALISDELDMRDFLPRPPRAPDSRQVDQALQDIGSDLPDPAAPAQPTVQYDFSAPYSPLEGGSPRPRWTKHPVLSNLLLEEKGTSEVQGDVEDSAPYQQASEELREETKPADAQDVGNQTDIPQSETKRVPGLGGAQYVVDVLPPQPCPNTQGHTSDANIRVGENVSEVANIPSVHGHASDAHIRVGEHVSDVTDILPSPSVHGHASDAHIRVGEHVSDVTDILPSPSLHGHASDAHIRVGEHVSDVTDILPSPSVHGHASDAHIMVGEHVSDVIDILPSPSVHGHASDAHIKVGEHMSDVVAPLPSPNVHGHSSDANIKVGGFVSDVSPSRPRWSKHGHSSDSTLKVGCLVTGSEPTWSPLPGSAYGHSSDSALGVGCMVTGPEVAQLPLLNRIHGHSSDSTLGVGCVVSGLDPLPSPLPGSAFGHSSDSTLGVGCMVLGPEPKMAPLPGSSHGHSSDSTLGMGCVVGGVKPGHTQQPHLTLGEDVTSSQTPATDLQTHNKEGSQDSPAGPAPFPLDEGLAAWALGLGLSPGGSPEDDYLLSLAGQYEVERYQDTYNLMVLAPDSPLLQQVMRGPFGLPLDPYLNRATDATAVQLSEMVSLPVLMKHSVTTPIITHVSLVNKAVVDYFFVELGVERHFEALRHFLLMEDGEFAQSLSDLLFEKLGNGQTPGELLTPLVLNSILNKALQYSLHGDSALAANFTFALRFLPETFHPHAPDSLNCLELRYKVDWPLNIIITDGCMNKYNRLFSFQLQLKHMVWTLRDVWFQLKRTALVKGAGRSAQFHQLQLYRHEMQHFVKVIQGYIANQILQVSWSEFTHKLSSSSDLDAIHRTHADYLNRAIFRGLLTEKAAPVMNIIHSIFSLILKFRAQLIAQPWDRQQGEAVHPSFIAMQQSYNTFKYYSHFLFKVVSKLVNKGYQPHLEDFLLRLNFNNYYKDS
ncbi:gamma-tubulin complex component 6 isoform X2 [Denticeps clupeoides]|uniref:gamma-tubulin complex component 6 isoform X2 n=1 Tax=Denticeps clupeoides TaxID=299321 RepID=UPI0010A3DB2F|nr:gamma-tubulin complex component 6 isoform X2 [Denticeps clupeoides]